MAGIGRPRGKLSGDHLGINSIEHPQIPVLGEETASGPGLVRKSRQFLALGGNSPFREEMKEAIVPVSGQGGVWCDQHIGEIIPNRVLKQLIM